MIVGRRIRYASIWTCRSHRGQNQGQGWLQTGARNFAHNFSVSYVRLAARFAHRLGELLRGSATQVVNFEFSDGGRDRPGMRLRLSWLTSTFLQCCRTSAGQRHRRTRPPHQSGPGGNIHRWKSSKVILERRTGSAGARLPLSTNTVEAVVDAGDHGRTDQSAWAVCLRNHPHPCHVRPLL